jgi:hypothetical protein
VLCGLSAPVANDAHVATTAGDAIAIAGVAELLGWCGLDPFEGVQEAPRAAADTIATPTMLNRGAPARMAEGSLSAQERQSARWRRGWDLNPG